MGVVATRIILMGGADIWPLQPHVPVKQQQTMLRGAVNVTTYMPFLMSVVYQPTYGTR